MESEQRVWTRNLYLLALTVFFMRLGQGLQSGVSTNFFVHDLGLGGDRVLWLAGIREVPGLLLVFLATLLPRLPLAYRGVLAILLEAVGYGAFALVHSYTALIAMALVASVGFHSWMPLQSSLAMGLVAKSHCGRVLGRMNSVGSLAALGGMLLISATVERLGMRFFYVLAAIAMVLGAALVSRLPRDIGKGHGTTERIVFKRRYWLYYVLTFFEGSRTQVFFTFGAWVLAEYYGMNAQRLPLLLVISGLVNWLASPWMGTWIDRFGERRVLLVSYIGLMLSFVGYALIHSVWALGFLYICINYLVISREALNTYINRIAQPGDLVPTLSAGVSVNHVTSVTMSLLAGTLLRVAGYEALSWGAAVVILLSCPFAWMVRTARPSPLPAQEPAPVAALSTDSPRGPGDVPA